MSRRTEQKQAARAGRLRREEQARRRQRRQQLMRRAGIATVGVTAAALVAVAVIGGGGRGGTASSDAVGATGSAGGPGIGTMAPSFALTNVVSGKQVTLRSLLGHKTLLFFSEGVGCQACMVQAADLQNNKDLTNAHIKLVSITTDPPSALAQAASQYGIRTPMLADPTTDMSGAYGMLAHGGMQHAGEDGHAFMLLDPNASVLWHQAYSQMYVNPSRLLTDMGARA